MDEFTERRKQRQDERLSDTLLSDVTDILGEIQAEMRLQKEKLANPDKIDVIVSRRLADAQAVRDLSRRGRTFLYNAIQDEPGSTWVVPRSKFGKRDIWYGGKLYTTEEWNHFVDNEIPADDPRVKRFIRMEKWRRDLRNGER